MNEKTETERKKEPFFLFLSIHYLFKNYVSKIPENLQKKERKFEKKKKKKILKEFSRDAKLNNELQFHAL